MLGKKNLRVQHDGLTVTTSTRHRSNAARIFDSATSQISYTVQTVTGDLPGAGTAAAVFITLHGSKGDSRRIQLSNSELRV